MNARRRVLVCCPDYASHWTPLSTVCTALARRGADVVVATGPTIGPRAAAAGHRWRELVLGVGRNPGVARVDEQPAGERDELTAFFEATRGGIVAALLHQARRRSHDLLHEPRRVIGDLDRIVVGERPDLVVVDHVSFVSTLAALALDLPFATFVPGHPSQLPVGEERYGVPPAWPAALRPSPAALDELNGVCDEVRDDFAARFRDALAARGSPRTEDCDPFRLRGTPVLLHQPVELADPERTAMLPADAHFVGPCTRVEALDGVTLRWVGDGGERPLVVVALGTFLSARADLLAVISAGLRQFGSSISVAVATGVSDPACLGDVPSDWLVRAVIPQVALVAQAAVLVHHGGNNSAMEAVAAGAAHVIIPLSTDQPATAADLERVGLAAVLDATALAPDIVADAVRVALTMSRSARDLAARLATRSGPDRCAEMLLDR
jgi:zeaxanthin glucosyltransferase